MKYREGIMEQTEKMCKSPVSSIKKSEVISSDEDETTVASKNVEENKIDNVTLSKVDAEEKPGKCDPENHADSSEKRESGREKKHLEVTEGLEPISSDEDEHTYDDPHDDDQRIEDGGRRKARFYSSTSSKGKAEKYSRAQRERSSTFYQRRYRTQQDASVLTELRIVSEAFMAKESRL